MKQEKKPCAVIPPSHTDERFNPTARERAFEELIGQLEKLYSDITHLRILATYTDLVLRKPTRVSPVPIEVAKPRQANFQADDAVDGRYSGVKLVNFSDIILTWELYLDIPNGQRAPLLQNQCGREHWKSVAEAAEEVRKAVLRVAGSKAADAVRLADAVDYIEMPAPESDTLNVSVLQRDLAWLIDIVRLVARQCQLMGDFGGSREPRSAAKVAWIATTLRKHAEALSHTNQFFTDYLFHHPQANLFAKEAERWKKFTDKMLGDTNNAGLFYTPPMIAKSIGVGVDTLRSCIKEMEKKGLIDQQYPENQGYRVKKTYNEDEADKISKYCLRPKPRKI